MATAKPTKYLVKKIAIIKKRGAQLPGIINLLLWTNSKGKKQYAAHFLLSEIMKQNAESNKIFDFEGSNIPSIADFNSKFGATDFPYPIYKVEKLPFWTSGLLKLKDKVS